MLAMQHDTMMSIDPPGSLRRIAEDPTMTQFVFVSETHICTSYLRYLTSPKIRELYVGISAQPSSPFPTVGASIESRWVTNTMTGNFKSRIGKTGTKRFCPLYRLVTLNGTDLTTQLRGLIDHEGDDSLQHALPDAIPRWLGEGEQGRLKKRK